MLKRTGLVARMRDKKSLYGVIWKPGRRKDPLDDVGISGMIILNESRRVHKIFLHFEESLAFQELCSLELIS
jgi:hypothetical protein